MGNKPFFQANIHSPGTGVALIVIAAALIPLAAVSLVQLSCFGRPSVGQNGWGDSWTIKRVTHCNGGG